MTDLSFTTLVTPRTAPTVEFVAAPAVGVAADIEDLPSHEVTEVSPAWRVMHRVVFGDERSIIDHLVIGPGGVLVIDALHHPDDSIWVVGDTVKINGQSERFVHRARHQAHRIEALLSRAAGREVGVRAVVAIGCDSSRFTVKRQPTGVDVVRRKEVPGLLASLPSVLGPDDVTTIESIARRSSTWA